MKPQRCIQCTTEFSCSSDKSCWCTGYPNISWATPLKSCYCPGCLLEAMAKEINIANTPPTLQIKKEIATVGLPETITEGIDYKLNSEGLMSLTRWYLLRRGHCCDNGCQNCPYKD